MYEELNSLRSIFCNIDHSRFFVVFYFKAPNLQPALRIFYTYSIETLLGVSLSSVLLCCVLEILVVSLSGPTSWSSPVWGHLDTTTTTLRTWGELQLYLYTSDGQRVCDLHVGNNCNIDHCRFFVIFAMLELRTCKQHSVSFAPTQKRIRCVLVSQS